MTPPKKGPEVEKLSDAFGQYELTIRCECGHFRLTSPAVLAKFMGWDTKLTDVAKRLRCSKCGKKACTLTASKSAPPRGYKSH